MIEQKKLIMMGIIGTPHGIKGEVRIKSFAEDPFALSRYHPLYDDKGKNVTIVSLRLHKTQLIAQIDGVTNRDAAQKLQGMQLFVERQSLDDDLDEDEFYQTDLIGFRVIALDAQGKDETIGRISAFFNFGAGDLVEIKNEAGKSWLVPFSRAAVPLIDKKQEIIRLDRLAAGLVAGEEDIARQ